MKKIKFYVAATFAALAMMMSSCMSDGSNERQFLLYGFADMYNSALPFATLFVHSDVDYPVYIPELNGKLTEGKPYIILVNVNYDDESNSDANIAKNKYVVASYQGINDKVIQQPIHPVQVEDMDNLLPNETKFTGIEAYALVQKHLFIELSMTNIPKDSEIVYNLNIDPSQEPEKQENSYYGKMNIYDVYIRTTVNSSESKTLETVNEIYAFGLPSQYSQIVGEESKTDNLYFALRFNYVKSIDEDKGTVTWEKASTLIPVYTGKNRSFKIFNTK